MYTGIIRGRFPVVHTDEKPGLTRLTIELPSPLTEGLRQGASVGLDGVCLTVAHQDGNRVSFDVMQETLRKTTLGSIKTGQQVNVERSASYGDEIGGHVVSGHVTGMAEIVHIEEPENNRALTFSVPRAWMKYVFPKGFIALDGCSLTVVDVDKRAHADTGTFSVWFIPETLRLTTFGQKGIGDRVNVEIDPQTQAIVDTVEATLEAMSLTGTLTPGKVSS